MSSDAIYQPTMVTDAACAAIPASPNTESVAGYALQRRLGAGGYGEVWHAIGPGGLHKAVKILHGRYDGPEAETELKSLERIRELHHPFLLNVERIEVADDRLIIVTELAEGSLEDVCLELQRQGQRGIPREMLLEYLHDAADALDFMYDHHGLQHLDIKPANLLIQGGHIKVADFGLLKDLKHTSVSLVGGFTPLYAPPELFEGRPSQASDQYSLAVVYQVMLTGVPPFAGRNPAQLIAQHLSSPPDLSALAPADRPAVARALSKNPHARFPSCREFIERLVERRGTHPAPASTARQAVLPKPEGPAPTVPPSACDRTGLNDPPTTRISAVSAPATALAPVELGAATVTYRPALFLGIGGLGGKVLCGLRRRLAERFGSGGDLPALPLLYVDTDTKAIGAACDQAGCGLRSHEAMAIALRDPQHYRSASRGLLEWLSRRWLYNIPRSSQVEGIRPLGRLALVDHHEALRLRLRRTLEAALADESLQATREQTGLPFASGPPAVYLVASLSGGTGSGAALDAAYLVRDLLTKLAVEHDGITGLLLHTTTGRDQLGDIQSTNTIACLEELRHFSTPGLGYPGDPACCLPSFDRSPFDHTYLVHLGDGLNEETLQDETRKMAEFLFRDAVTPARAFFEACHGPERNLAARRAELPGLRTFGVAGGHRRVDEKSMQPAVEALCRAVVRHWLGDGKRGESAEIENRSAGLPAELPLDAEPWLARAGAILRGAPAKAVEAYFRTRWEQYRRFQGGKATALRLESIDQEFLAKPLNQPAAGHPASFLRSLEEELAAFGRTCVEAIRGEILSRIDSPEHRCSGASEILGEVASRLDQAAASLSVLISEMGKDVDGLRRQISPATAEPAFREFTEPERTVYSGYCTIRLYEAVHRCLAGCIQAIRIGVRQMAAELTALRWHLRELDDRHSRTLADRQAASAEPSLVASFENRLRTSRQTKPSSLLAGDDLARERLMAALGEEAAHFLADRLPIDDSVAGPSPAHSAADGSWEQSLAPRLSNVGGGRRILAVLRDEASQDTWNERLQSAFGQCVTLQTYQHGSTFLCCEVEGIGFETVLARLKGQNPKLAEMASRIHTRVDVQW